MINLILENKKIYIIVFVVVAIIIIALIWIPKNSEVVGNYKALTDKEIDNMVAKQYGDELQFALYTKDMTFLNEKVLPSYLEYNSLDFNNYRNWLIEEDILVDKVKFKDTSKIQYKNTNIYTTEMLCNGVSKKVNIIERYPEEWYYTFGTFINYKTEPISILKFGYGLVINSIYQDMNYISFNCSLYVDNNTNRKVDISKSDSIKLVLEDGSSFIMATNNYTTEGAIIDDKIYTNVECIFNIPIGSQAEIESIVFNSFEINNNVNSIKISLDI